jgi:hypothetical protein
MAGLVRKALKFAGAGVGLVVCGGATFFYLVKPSAARPADLKVEMSAARIARGKYLFAVADCDGCHSVRDFTRFGGPVVEHGRGAGSVFPKELGMPGVIAAANITPDKETGIGAWTDGEKVRAIREGVSRDGHPLFPMMGYTRFRRMSDDDVQSLVAYLNSLEPVRNRVPRSQVNFPVSMLIRTAPQPAGHVANPDRSNRLKYGEYLANLAGCAECHTGESGDAFAGGAEFKFPGMRVVSANITPDPDTGIGSWSEEMFVSRFTVYRAYAEKGTPKTEPSKFTIMPWLSLAQMEPDDLKAVYAYLRTQPAIYKKVEKHPDTVRASL